jgi:hypothetical protein
MGHDPKAVDRDDAYTPKEELRSLTSRTTYLLSSEIFDNSRKTTHSLSVATHGQKDALQSGSHERFNHARGPVDLGDQPSMGISGREPEDVPVTVPDPRR